MLAVHVRVGHEHNLVVARLINGEFVANTRTKSSNHSLNLGIRQGTIKPGPLDVKNFAAQRQNRLRIRVSALHRRTTRRITLHQINLGN